MNTTSQPENDATRSCAPVAGSGLVDAMRRRADRWEQDQGSIGAIVASEIRTVVDAMAADNDRLRSLASELLDMVEQYHALEWEEEPFTPVIEDLRARLGETEKFAPMAKQIGRLTRLLQYARQQITVMPPGLASREQTQWAEEVADVLKCPRWDTPNAKLSNLAAERKDHG